MPTLTRTIARRTRALLGLGLLGAASTGVSATSASFGAAVSRSTSGLGRAAAHLGSGCTTGHATVVGRLQDAPLSPNGRTSAYGATYAWSDCTTPSTCTTLTATVGPRSRGSDVSVTTSRSTALVPTAAVGALATPSGVARCSAANTSTSTCQPAPHGVL